MLCHQNINSCFHLIYHSTTFPSYFWEDKYVMTMATSAINGRLSAHSRRHIAATASDWYRTLTGYWPLSVGSTIFAKFPLFLNNGLACQVTLIIKMDYIYYMHLKIILTHLKYGILLCTNSVNVLILLNHIGDIQRRYQIILSALNFYPSILTVISYLLEYYDTLPDRGTFAIEYKQLHLTQWMILCASPLIETSTAFRPEMSSRRMIPKL